MIESIRLLISANEVSARHLLKDIEIDPKLTEEKMLASPAVTTALLPFIGYNRAAEMAECMKEYGLSVYEANRKLGFMKEEKLKEILKPENLVQGGYRLKDLEE
jgi:fumarate hydratase class II